MKINIGCGTDIRKDFLNVDIRNLPSTDVTCDAIDLRNFIKNEEVEFIVAQHLLEYIPRDQLLIALEEWTRILKPSGILEIRVTDIKEVTKALYLNTISKEMGLHHEMVLSLLYGKRAHQYDVKYNGFTSEFLQGILVGQGFEIISTAIENYDIILTTKKK